MTPRLTKTVKTRGDIQDFRPNKRMNPTINYGADSSVLPVSPWPWLFAGYP
jgi:hypothetical protein